MLIKLIFLVLLTYSNKELCKEILKIFISSEYTPKNPFFNFDQFKLSEDLTSKKNIVFLKLELGYLIGLKIRLL